MISCTLALLAGWSWGRYGRRLRELGAQPPLSLAVLVGVGLFSQKMIIEMKNDNANRNDIGNDIGNDK